jgi:hypothetical protein
MPSWSSARSSAFGSAPPLPRDLAGDAEAAAEALAEQAAQRSFQDEVIAELELEKARERSFQDEIIAEQELEKARDRSFQDEVIAEQQLDDARDREFKEAVLAESELGELIPLKLYDAERARKRNAVAQRSRVVTPTIQQAPLTIDPVLAGGYHDAVAWLKMVSPKTLTRLDGARHTFDGKGPEFAAQTALSCRRALASLADSVRPPSGPSAGRDGTVRRLDAESYNNRLLRYLEDLRLPDTTVAVVSDEIAAHASRLDRLTRHFGKSVHAEPSDPDAWMAYVQTWNIVIQLAHLARD